MQIVVNGELKEVSDGVRLPALLPALGIEEGKIAIELNRQVVRKRDWPAVILQENDIIEIVHFVGGG